ncbi:hypothetical protein BCV69DRAFT_299164 [Microstroma glucosiphilum]|uniref:Uncharacterized protein n=1 Tax=Pseudomicrostroma glucosiphilum TaxID=1684307 RepID=A0A316U8I5_9BASI|nr:hypothetical protein BCV69DRAFT_299164 [Pseudomicrostroma glucosiphilum]PWN20683.1 hypothetical protein BCV69DRAFT_299164 [Pseudomicrostroma glucosiphilum]
MTLSSGASLKKVKAQAGRKKPAQALKRPHKVSGPPREGHDLKQSDTDKVPDDQQVPNRSVQKQENQTFALNSAPGLQPALVDHAGLADVLSGAASTAFTFPPYTPSYPVASPYKQRLEEIQHRRAESERLQRALASNSHLQLVVFCHRNDAYNFLPDGASIADMGSDQNTGDNLVTDQALSAANVDVSGSCSDNVIHSRSIDIGTEASIRKKQSKKPARGGAKKVRSTLPDSKSQVVELEIAQAPPLASWDDATSTSARSTNAVADDPCSSPLLSPQNQSENKRKHRNSRHAPRLGSTPSSSRPSSRISGTTETSEASELDLGQMLLSSQAAAAAGSRTATKTTTKAQRRRAKLKQTSRLFDTQDSQESSPLRSAKNEEDLVGPAERTHQVRRIHIGPLPQPSRASALQLSSTATSIPNISSAPMVSTKSRAQGTANRPSSSASSSQPSTATSWKVKGILQEPPNHLRSYTTESTIGQPNRAGVESATKGMRSSSVEQSTPPSLSISGSSSTGADKSQIRSRSIPGAPPATLLPNKEVKLSTSKPQREKERLRLARERKQEELHRQRIAEAVAAAERGEKLSICPQEPQRESESVRSKKPRPVVSVPALDDKPTEIAATAELQEGFSPRSRESAISKTETDDSYHTAASNIPTSSPSPKSPRQASDSSCERQSDEGEFRDSSSVRSTAPSMLFSPLSTGSATITCFSPLQTPLVLDTPQCPHWHTGLEHGQSSHRPNCSKQIFSSGDRKHSPSITDSTDTSEVTGSQYGPSPPSDSSVDFGCPQPNALTGQQSPVQMQIRTGADPRIVELRDLGPATMPLNEDLTGSMDISSSSAEVIEASSNAQLDERSCRPQDLHTRRVFIEPTGTDVGYCYHPGSSCAMAEPGTSVFCRGAGAERPSQQGLSSLCSIYPSRIQARHNEGARNTTGQAHPLAQASPPSSLTVIPEPLDSNGIESCHHADKERDRMHRSGSATSARQSLGLFPTTRTKSPAMPHHHTLPAKNNPSTTGSDLTDPVQLSIFKRCVSELNAFEDHHQRRSRAREERLARLHCYDLEGFVETKKTVVETDGPFKGRKRIVRLWRTHSMLAPGRRLSAKFDFDPSVAVAASKAGLRHTNGALVPRARCQDYANASRVPSADQSNNQNVLVGSSSLPDGLSQLVRPRYPVFAPHYALPSLACDTSASDLSRSSEILGPIAEHECSLNGMHVARPSGLVRAFLDGDSTACTAPFEDTTECLIKSASTSFETRPDLNWLDSLRSLGEQERVALRCFLRAQVGASDHPFDSDCSETGEDGAEQALLPVPVAAARSFAPSIYPTMGSVTGPNGQSNVENGWEPMPHQLYRSGSNLSSATYWPSEPSLQYEIATSAVSSPHGPPFTVSGQQAPHYESYYSSSPHLLPTSSHSRPALLPHQTESFAQRSHSRELAAGRAWSPVPPPAPGYYSDGSDLAHSAGSASSQTEPEAQMEALVAAVQRCLSADGSGHEGGHAALSEKHFHPARLSDCASDDLASRYSSSSVAENPASSAGESPLHEQNWSGAESDNARRHVSSRMTLAPHSQQQRGHLSSVFKSRPDGPAGARNSQAHREFEYGARAPQRQRGYDMSWHAQDLPFRSDRSNSDSAPSDTWQDMARIVPTENRNAPSLNQPYRASEFEPLSSSGWYAQPIDLYRDLDHRQVQGYNELPRSQSTFIPQLPSPSAEAKGSSQALGTGSTSMAAYRGSQVDGIPLLRYSQASNLDRSHPYAEDHTGRATSTYGKRFPDSTQELQNESRRAVQEEAAMLYAYGSRMQAARGLAPQGRVERSEHGQASQFDEQEQPRHSLRYHLPNIEVQSRARNGDPPGDNATYSRSVSSPRQGRSSSRSDAQDHVATRPNAVRIAGSMANFNATVPAPNGKYDAEPSHSSDRSDNDKQMIQRRHKQQSDPQSAGGSISYEGRQYSLAQQVPSSPCQDEDQTVRIDRGRAPRHYPSQEQQFNNHRQQLHQQSFSQPAHLPPRPAGIRDEAASAWDEPQRREANRSEPKQQQRPQQPASFGHDDQQRSPSQYAQRSDTTSNRTEQPPHSSYEYTQRASTRPDGQAQRGGGGGRGRGHRGSWKQARWEEREASEHDRNSGSSGHSPAERAVNFRPGQGGRGGGQAGHGVRGTGISNRLDQR